MDDERFVFCENCREIKPYSTHTEVIETTLKGRKVKFQGQVPHCRCCGEPVFVDEIEKGNIDRLKTRIRTIDDLIPLDKIREIPKKYDIGKRPLSLILGWGEQTFTRYYEGYLPKKANSDILKRIHRDLGFYLEMLEAKKDILLGGVYDKSYKCVQKILGADLDRISVIDDATQLIVQSCPEVTNLGLQKLLYWVQGIYSAFYGKSLFVEDCQAWAHGPVYPEVYYKYRDCGKGPVVSKVVKRTVNISSEANDVIHAVCVCFGLYSAWTLAHFTHKEKPWMAMRVGLKPREKSNRVISKSAIQAYFMEVFKSQDIKSLNQIYLYSQSLFSLIQNNMSSGNIESDWADLEDGDVFPEEFEFMV